MVLGGQPPGRVRRSHVIFFCVIKILFILKKEVIITSFFVFVYFLVAYAISQGRKFAKDVDIYLMVSINLS